MPTIKIEKTPGRRPAVAAAGALASALLTLVLACNAPGEASPTERWQCRNDLEVRCGEGACDAETGDAFTPMSVTFDTAGAVSVCAYTGCWEGTGEIVGSGDILVLIAHDLEFSTLPSAEGAREDVAIVLDRQDGVATLKVGEFAHPLLCEPLAR